MGPNDHDEDDRDDAAAPKADAGAAKSKSPWGGAAGSPAEAPPSDPGSGTKPGGGPMTPAWGGMRTMSALQGPGPGAAAGGGPQGVPNWGMVAQRLGAAPAMGGTAGEGIRRPGMAAAGGGMHPGMGWLQHIGQMLAQRHAAHRQGGPWGR